MAPRRNGSAAIVAPLRNRPAAKALQRILDWNPMVVSLRLFACSRTEMLSAEPVKATDAVCRTSVAIVRPVDIRERAQHVRRPHRLRRADVGWIQLANAVDAQ